ncbi:hypothetical protein, partial [Marinobacter sp.]
MTRDQKSEERDVKRAAIFACLLAAMHHRDHERVEQLADEMESMGLMVRPVPNTAEHPDERYLSLRL